MIPVVWLLCLRHKWIRVWLSQIDWYQLYDCFVYDDPSLRWAIIVVVIWLSCGRDIAKYNHFHLAQMASYISISSCNGHHRSELCIISVVQVHMHIILVALQALLTRKFNNYSQVQHSPSSAPKLSTPFSHGSPGYYTRIVS